jgi:hypothetical protein
MKPEVGKRKEKIEKRKEGKKSRVNASWSIRRMVDWSNRKKPFNDSTI